MNGYKRLHSLTAALFLRKALLLCLLPLARVLLARDWLALRAALRQDAALLCLLAAASWALLRFSGWTLDGAGVLRLRWAFGARYELAVPQRQIIAVVIEQPALLRLLGASRVTIYLKGQRAGSKITLCLSKRDAATLADALLPAEHDAAHRAAGAEKTALAVLGANGLSTLALLWVALRESEGIYQDARVLAYAGLGHLAAFAARWLPAGAAWLLALAAVLWGASLLRSAAQTARHTAFGGSSMLGCRGGLVGRYECRVKRSALSRAEARLSPAAYILRRAPLYIASDGFECPLPLLVCGFGDEAALASLLPGFVMPPRRRANTAGRSIPAFFMPQGLPFGVCCVLTLASVSALPALTPVLALLCAAFAPSLIMAQRGFVREGAWLCGGRLVLCRQRGVRLHCVCVYRARSLETRQNPWAAAAGRADLTVRFARKSSETVRSVPLSEAGECFAFLAKQ